MNRATVGVDGSAREDLNKSRQTSVMALRWAIVAVLAAALPFLAQLLPGEYSPWSVVRSLCVVGSPFGAATFAALAVHAIPTRHRDLRAGAVGIAVLFGFFSVILFFAYILDAYPD